MQLPGLLLLACIAPAVTVYPGEILGPRNLTSRIAIVGAGGAGVHMAHLLKIKGFTDVTLIERTNDVGGDSRTVIYRGEPNEMGDPLLFPHYDIVRELVNDYFAFGDELVDVRPVFGSFAKEGSAPVGLQEYLAIGASRLLETQGAGSEFADQIEKYIRLHREMFGNYSGFIFPEPTWEVKYETYGTFADFLVRNKLQAIQLTQTHAMAMLGLGFFDEIPALYGLMWMTPKVMTVYLNILRGGQQSPHQILKSGFQNLWRRVVAADNLRVLFNTEARSLQRTSDFQRVLLQLRTGGIDRIETYDFVIWTANLRNALEFWRDPSSQEYFMFLRSTYQSQIGVMLFDSIDITRGTTPFGVLSRNVEGKLDDATYIMWEPYAARNRQSGEAFRTGNLPTGQDNSTSRTAIAYAFSRYRASTSASFNAFSRLPGELGAKNFSSIQQVAIRFNPQATASDLTNSFIYRILEIQGKYGMWYTGSIPSFDSVMAKMEYNKLLVETMRPPGKGDGNIISR